MNQTFSPGSRFFEWNGLPIARVPGPDATVLLNYAFEPPREMSGRGDAPITAREISFEEFEELRATLRKLFGQPRDTSES